jgi:hypothetical protein
MEATDLAMTIRSKGLKRMDIAEMTHKSIRQVFNWLNGTTPIPLDSAELIELKTGMLPDVGTSDDPVPSE